MDHDETEGCESDKVVVMVVVMMELLGRGRGGWWWWWCLGGAGGGVAPSGFAYFASVSDAAAGPTASSPVAMTHRPLDTQESEAEAKDISVEKAPPPKEMCKKNIRLKRHLPGWTPARDSLL